MLASKGLEVGGQSLVSGVDSMAGKGTVEAAFAGGSMGVGVSSNQKGSVVPWGNFSTESCDELVVQLKLAIGAIGVRNWSL